MSTMPYRHVISTDYSPIKEKYMYAANGTPISIIGEAIIDIAVEGATVPTYFLISEEIAEPILGAYWLAENKCIWNFEEGKIKIGTTGVETTLIAKHDADYLLRLVATASITVEPHSARKVITRVQGGSIKGGVEQQWLATGGEIEENLLVANTLLPERDSDIPLLIMNLSDEAIEVDEDNVLAEIEPVTAIGNIGQISTDRQNTIHNGDYQHILPLLENLPDEMTQQEKANLKNLLIKYANAFSKHEFDLGRTTVVTHSIDTNGTRPIKQSLRRHPREMLEKIDEHVEKLEKAGIVEKAYSPWSSNIVLLQKKDKSIRFTVDYRKVNEATEADSYPLPRIDDCLEALGGAKYFSTCDLAQGFHQVVIDSESRDKTCFVTRKGSFVMTRMPMGLKNSSSSFMRLMNIVMQGLDFNICLCFIDDVIIYSETIPEHLERLEMVFERLQEANLKLKVSKCHLLQHKVQFLGYIVSEEGIGADPEKTAAVERWPTPTTVKQVRQFVGLIGYYRKTIPEFAKLAKPLHTLTEKGRRFQWTEECDAAFTALKRALVTSPVLALPNDVDMYVLDVDACDVSIGGVLSQMQQGEEKVIAYASRLLSGSEKNYCVTRKELLAFVFFIKKFKHYLLGRKFIVRTDHAALQWLRKTPEPIGQQARYLEILEAFDFTVTHRSGKQHTNADALSRIPCEECNDYKHATTINSLHLAPPVKGNEWSTDTLKNETVNDEELKEVITLITRDDVTTNELNSMSNAVRIYWNQRDRLKLKNDLVYRKYYKVGENDIWQWVPPVKYRKEIIRECHSGFTGGHCNVQRTKEKVQSKAYWAGWAADVEIYVKQCEPCATYFRGNLPRRAGLQSHPIGAPWMRLSMDICGPFPTSARGNKFIMTVIDNFTKFAFAIPLRNHEAHTVASVLVEKIFSYYGIPFEILSDCAPEYESKLLKELCRLLDICKLRTSGYKPSTNGMIERFHRTLNTMLAKVVEKNQRNWDAELPHVVAAYRATAHSSTGYTPNYLMFGRETRAPLDIVLGETSPEAAHSYSAYVAEKKELMTKAYEKARETLGNAAKTSTERYNMRVRPREHKTGDFVYFYYPRIYSNRSPKLQRMFKGPYKVIEKLGAVNYKIQMTRKSKPFIVHADKLRPHYGDEPPGWSETRERTLQGFPREDDSETDDAETEATAHEMPTTRPRRAIKRPTRYL